VVDGGEDRNTIFANSHRRYNHMDSLSINGSMSNNPLNIKEHVVHFYNKQKKLYTEQCTWQPSVDDLSFLSIDVDKSNCVGLLKFLSPRQHEILSSPFGAWESCVRHTMSIEWFFIEVNRWNGLCGVLLRGNESV
jgi:hypothetical protein